MGASQSKNTVTEIAPRPSKCTDAESAQSTNEVQDPTEALTEALTKLKAAMKTKERQGRNFHILFIGASGAGKTSLLNLIGQFGLINEHGVESVITDFKRYNDPQLERRPDERMVSKTSSTKSYDIKIGDVTLNITDTPGLGVDSAGIGKEKENLRNIVEHLKKVDYVDCVCLVINGRTPRGIPEVQHALSEISLLPDVANSNMILCITNAKDITVISLDFEILKGFFKREIQREKIFFFENAVCRLENVKKLSQKTERINGTLAQKENVNHASFEEEIKDSFKLSLKEFCKVLQTIKELHPLHTACFMEVYKAKEEVEMEILAITVHQYNLAQLHPKEDTKKEKPTIVRISCDTHYNTLCDYPGCYSVCHPQCHLPHSFDTDVFKDCACMGQTQSVCTICHHSYTTHYHQFVRFDRIEVKIEDKIIADEIKKATDALQSLSKKMETFYKLSSGNNYLQALNNQLQMVKLHQSSYGDTEALQVAQKRIETAIQTVKPCTQ